MLVATVIALSIISDARPNPLVEGEASYYTVASSGYRTASGERMNDSLYTCAMLKGEFGDYVNVVAENGNSVVCKVNDRGPHVKGRVIDLSKAAMRKLTNGGLIKVKVYASPKKD